MSGLVLVIGDESVERFRTALVMACANAALDRKARLFFQGDALRLIRLPMQDPDAPRQASAGLPTLAQLLDEALSLGVTIAACQSSLALLDLDTGDFDSCVEWGGMIGLLADILPDDRLIMA